MVFGKFPDSGSLFPGLGRRFHHVVVLVGVIPSMGGLIYFDPARPTPQNPHFATIGRPLRTQAQMRSHATPDDFGTIYGSYPMLRWVGGGSDDLEWQAG